MPLEDVSHDASLVNWLHQSGHGHLLDDQTRPGNAARPISPPILTSSGLHTGDYATTINHSASFPVGASSYDSRYSPSGFISPHAQFSPYFCDQQQQHDVNIESIQHDPNTKVIHKPAQDDVVYKQRIFVKYLQPPTPPVGGTIIIREKQLPPPPPDPPLVIRRAAPPPPTPPPIIIRERPPLIPPPEPTTIINKIIPPPPKPPRQVIIEQCPPLPPKPRNVIIERWLPVPPRQRRILYERLAAPVVCQPPITTTNPIIIPNNQPQVCQSSCTCISCNPCPTTYQRCTCVSQPATIPTTCCSVPLTCTCASTSSAGLSLCGCDVPVVPTPCQPTIQTAACTIPAILPANNTLCQIGMGPCCVQRPATFI